jgi:hypothetical protein
MSKTTKFGKKTQGISGFISKPFVNNEYSKISLSKLIFGSFLLIHATNLIEFHIKSMATRKRMQWDHIQLLTLKINHTISCF